MRSLLCAACLAAVLPAAAGASDTATSVVVVSATFSSRTSLRVSTDLLRFDIQASDQPVTVPVDFFAAARTHTGGEVMLSVEATRTIIGPGGAADVETALSFEGEGEGTTTGLVTNLSPTVAARWMGSGSRHGRLVFRLRSAATGHYTVPLRFVLSTP